MEGLAAEILPHREQLLCEPGQHRGLSGPGEQSQHQAGRQRGRREVRVVIRQPALKASLMKDESGLLKFLALMTTAVLKRNHIGISKLLNLQ